MAQASNLPTEKLDIVFPHLPQQTLMECQIVCRSWYSRATLYAMRHVTFHNTAEVYVFWGCNANMTKLVQKITVEGPPMNELIKPSVRQLMMKVPNLQELELKNNLLSMENLNAVRLPRNLTSINYPGSYYFTNGSVNYYMNILFKHRNTIEKFNISSSHNFRKP